MSILVISFANSRHELIDEDSKVTQEIRDRELALQDPHTLSLLEKTKQLVKMTPPVDQSIASIFICSLILYADIAISYWCAR